MDRFDDSRESYCAVSPEVMTRRHVTHNRAIHCENEKEKRKQNAMFSERLANNRDPCVPFLRPTFHRLSQFTMHF